MGIPANIQVGRRSKQASVKRARKGRLDPPFARVQQVLGDSRQAAVDQLNLNIKTKEAVTVRFRQYLR